MSMLQYSEDELSFEQEFNYGVLSSGLFAAFLSAIEARKDEDDLTQAELAARSDKDETSISRITHAPQNFTVKTISRLCVALDLEYEFCLIDKRHPYRVFTATGVEYARPIIYGNTMIIETPLNRPGAPEAWISPSQDSPFSPRIEAMSARSWLANVGAVTGTAIQWPNVKQDG